MTHSRKRIVELLNAHGLHPSRALGQNFVADANTVRRIARLAEVGPGDHVVEIGGGLGSLTLALAETGARVTVIELDKRMAPVLREVTAEHNVTVIEGDALKVDWNNIVLSGETATVVANLPYNVGTSIVATLLDEVPQVSRMVVMVQKEVGERLAANVGSSAYGALSVKVRYYADAKVLGIVPPTVFVPKPEVDSALVEICRLETPRIDVDREALFVLVRAGFAHRRKMLRGALKDVVNPDVFVCAEIEPTARAEELDVEDWGRLTSCYKK